MMNVLFAAIQEESRSTENDVMHLEKAAGFFSERLGITLKKVSGKYSILHISKLQQERPLGQRKTPPACISLFCDIYITVVMQYWQIYVQHTPLLPLKM